MGIAPLLYARLGLRKYASIVINRLIHARVFSIQIFQYLRQIQPRVCTLVLFIENISGNNLEAVQNRIIDKSWSTLAPGLVVVGGELWRSATLE